jgi:hypothetical protein
MTGWPACSFSSTPQTPAAICRMTIVDLELDVDPVRLHLGGSPIHLPEPVADLTRSVSSNRKGHATIGALTRFLDEVLGVSPCEICYAMRSSLLLFECLSDAG